MLPPFPRERVAKEFVEQGVPRKPKLWPRKLGESFCGSIWHGDINDCNRFFFLKTQVSCFCLLDRVLDTSRKLEVSTPCLKTKRTREDAAPKRQGTFFNPHFPSQSVNCSGQDNPGVAKIASQKNVPKMTCKDV